MQQYFFQFQTIPNKLTCLHHGTWTSISIASWCFVFYFKRWAHNSLAMSNNAFFNILNISFHLLSSYSMRRKCEYQVVFFGLNPFQKSTTISKVIKTNMMCLFCIKCHINVHLDAFVTFISLDVGKSWVILGLLLLWLTTKNKFRLLIMLRPKSFGHQSCNHQKQFVIALTIENFPSPSFWCVIMALPFTWKNILRQKKNYGNSKISPCKNVIFKKKSFKKNQTPSRYHNSITNPKFQHNKISFFKNPRIKIDLLHGGPKTVKLLYFIMNLNTISSPW
jgi:hypothetical protein